MGEAASLLRGSCKDLRKICNDASIHSQCCDKEDGCNCDAQTHETQMEDHEDIEVRIGGEGVCCNLCLIRKHK